LLAYRNLYRSINWTPLTRIIGKKATSERTNPRKRKKLRFRNIRSSEE
jgi:hypothetical protein